MLCPFLYTVCCHKAWHYLLRNGKYNSNRHQALCKILRQIFPFKHEDFLFICHSLPPFSSMNLTPTRKFSTTLQHDMTWICLQFFVCYWTLIIYNKPHQYQPVEALHPHTTPSSHCTQFQETCLTSCTYRGFF